MLFLFGSLSMITFGAWFWMSYQWNQEASEGQALEGAFRGMYILIWILFLLFTIVVFVPLANTFRGQLDLISGNPAAARIILLKILSLPVLFLVLVKFGAVRGYLRWIGNLSWGREK